MPQPGGDASEVDIRELTQRVERIERYLGISAGAAVSPAKASAAEKLPERPAGSSDFLPVLGRALLGLAGAYLLRSLTESGRFAPKAGVAVGLLYALAWLVWAARTPATRRMEAALHSLTAALVLSPLLWEATLRFHAVSTWTAGIVLLFFTIFGLTVSWQKELLIVATIATLAGLGTSAALLIATHDVLPFTFVFLATAAAVEVSACLNHWLSERWLAAVMANLAVLLATWLVTNQRGLPQGYAPIPHGWLAAAQAALLAVYLSSTIVRTLLRGFTFTLFETAQCAMAFLISVSGGLRLSTEDPRVGPAIGLLALACAAASYVVSFVLLDRGGSRRRNFYTYSTFGILLALVGTLILVSGSALSASWSALAIACVWGGGLFGRMTLQAHGAIYLVLALGASGALKTSAEFLLGAATWQSDGPASMLWATAAALIAYILVARYSSQRDEWNFQALRLTVSAALIWLTAGMAAGIVTGAYHAAFGESATHAYCATMRTGVLAIAALILAWTGSRWKHSELTQLIYPAMLLAAYRMVMIDMHGDRTPALFLSLLIYGGTLTVLPRLRRARTAA